MKVGGLWTNNGLYWYVFILGTEHLFYYADILYLVIIFINIK